MSSVNRHTENSWYGLFLRPNVLTQGRSLGTLPKILLVASTVLGAIWFFRKPSPPDLGSRNLRIETDEDAFSETRSRPGTPESAYGVVTFQTIEERVSD
ncbi:MAG: hypothetical protein AB7N99_08150 [Simkaniaceae bacterium]